MALATAVIWGVRKSAVGIFFAAWFLLMLTPVVLYAIRLQLHDRYFYLGSVATSIGLAYLIARLNRFGNAVQALATMAILASMATLTFNYSSYWDNDFRLFTRVVQIAPHNGSACRYMAETYISRHEPEKAEALGRNLLADPQSSAIGWYIIGNVSLSREDYESAREAMRKSVDVSPGNNLLASVALADADMHLNRSDEAAELYRAQLKQYPEMPYLKDRLALALTKMPNQRQ
jgi:tetratricopeptide (TPR) repeat protein